MNSFKTRSARLLCVPCQGVLIFRVRYPAGELSFQPEALGATQEATNELKHSKQKAVSGRSANHAGRSVQRTPSRPRKAVVGADPP